MKPTDAAKMIDISAVRTHHSYRDICQIVEYAKQYRFINVHSLPCWTRTVSELLKDEPDIYTGAPVGFPGGGHTTAVKLAEARGLVEDGVQEMDIVMNVGKFKNREYDYVLNEIRQIRSILPGDIMTKVIIELNCLTDEELDIACDLVMESGVDFLKTGTGWVPGNANIERIAHIKQRTAGKVMVKAAGGIRTRAEFDALLALGVERFGINTKSALEIVQSFA